MKPRFLLWLSLLLNLGLGAAILQAKFQRQPLPTPPSPTVTVAPPAPIAAECVAQTETNSMAPNLTTRVESFSWGKLAAGDYKIYRDNLFAISCPTQTVHEIMLAVINHNFRERRDLLTAAIQPRFWDTAALSPAALKALAEPVTKLGAERDTVIQEVLGGEELEEPHSQAASETNRWARTYAWLPPDKQLQMVALEIEKAKRQREFWNANAPNPRDADDEITRETANQKLEAEFAARRKQVLSPEEDAELTLRNSDAARWSRNIPGFEVNETEWRSVAQLKLQYDEVRRKFMTMDEALQNRYGIATMGSSAPAPDPVVQAQLKNELDAAVKSVLGEQRFGEYELGADGNYRQTQRITARYGLSDSLAKQAYDMQRTAINQAGQLRLETSLSAEARTAALVAIRREAERSLAQSLGPKVFNTYQKYQGDWLKQLDPPADQ